MRIFAVMNLLYLALLTASTVSAIHVDHDGSHEKVCSGEINARCHAEVPHEHDEAHGGEESLFEHTFENGIRKNPVSAPLVSAMLVVVLNLPVALAQPVTLFTQSLRNFCDDHPPALFFTLSSPRAPPVA